MHANRLRGAVSKNRSDWVAGTYYDDGKNQISVSLHATDVGAGADEGIGCSDRGNPMPNECQFRLNLFLFERSLHSRDCHGEQTCTDQTAGQTIDPLLSEVKK
jgi:hypothetical protein